MGLLGLSAVLLYFYRVVVDYLIKSLWKDYRGLYFAREGGCTDRHMSDTSPVLK